MARPRLLSDEQIDAAARAVFLAHGPQASVALIGEKLGVSHAALLQRAGSKERLLLRALGPDRPPDFPALSAQPPSVGARERLVELLLELHTCLTRVLPGLLVLRSAGVVMEAVIADAEPSTVALRRQLGTWLARTRAFEPRRARALAEALLSTLEAHCYNAHVGGPSFAGGPPKRLLEGLLDALAPELARKSSTRRVRRERRRKTP